MHGGYEALPAAEIVNVRDGCKGTNMDVGV